MTGEIRLDEIDLSTISEHRLTHPLIWHDSGSQGLVLVIRIVLGILTTGSISRNDELAITRIILERRVPSGYVCITIQLLHDVQ